MKLIKIISKTISYSLKGIYKNVFFYVCVRIRTIRKIININSVFVLILVFFLYNNFVSNFGYLFFYDFKILYTLYFY
jgi:hypothetical protein